MGYRCTYLYRGYRYAQGETVHSLGRKVLSRSGVPVGPGTISNIERGDRAMRTKMATKMALALGMPLRQAIKEGLIEHEVGAYPPKRELPEGVVNLAARSQSRRNTTSGR